MIKSDQSTQYIYNCLIITIIKPQSNKWSLRHEINKMVKDIYNYGITYLHSLIYVCVATASSQLISPKTE